MLGIATFVEDTLRYAGLLGSSAVVPAFAKARNRPATIRVPGTGSISLRPGSDWNVFNQVIIDQEYKLPEDVRPRFIIDAGANIGLTAAYFAARYPDAVIYAIEPEPANFAMLERNTAGFANVRRYHGAIWSHSAASLAITNPSAASWCFTVAEGSGTTRGLTIGSLLDESGFDRIDVLKLDVEGSELEVLRDPDCPKWLHRTDLLLIELHDPLKRGCSMALYDRIRDMEFQQRSRGDSLQIDLRGNGAAHPAARIA
jgi:FkbM family methyltransferase